MKKKLTFKKIILLTVMCMVFWSLNANARMRTSEVTDYGNEVSVQEDIKPTDIVLSHDIFYMLKGEIRKITATVLPEDATDKTVTWVSGDESIATVFDGVVFSQDWGSTEVTATTSNGLSATCKIEVVHSIVHPTSIILSHEELNMKVGEIIQVTATLEPEDVTEKTVKWVIDDESVAIVDKNGIVTAKSVGTTELTAYSTSNGLSAKCLIEVVASDTQNETDWAGHYQVTASLIELNVTREYPDVFEMDIEKVGDVFYVTSMFGVDLTQFNLGGFQLQDNGDGTATVDIRNKGILEYTNESNPLYAIYVLDKDTEVWKNTWEYSMNPDGSLSIESFFVVAFTWSEEDQAWTNGNMEAFYSNIKAKKGDAIDRLDLYLWGSLCDWEFLYEWKFIPYEGKESVYYLTCPDGKRIGTMDSFRIITEDASLVYGVQPGFLDCVNLDELMELCEGIDSWQIMLDKEWTGICWFDLETATVVFSNDPDYVAPFANSAVRSINDEDSDSEEYYNLKGQKVDKDHLGSGIYIVRKGNTSKKVMVK